ncbi:MAG TPA: GAF domain-containing protein [Candidatus Handelsmanbacteria bacterium]|nr:GAF domain-containing protein [Candidatus Handelsmanbacteria bacterium]
MACTGLGNRYETYGGTADRQEKQNSLTGCGCLSSLHISTLDGVPMTTERLDQDLEDRLRRLNEIGAALSLERDLHALLDRILLEARRFTGADAGTLYLVRGTDLTFEVAQNDTLTLANDEMSASGYCAVTGETLNINNVYAEDTPLTFVGPRQYDAMTGYHTESMLVVPMRDHEDQITGVLQLLNAKEPSTGDIRAFPRADEALVLSLASQAAVSVNNVRLIDDTERLFQSFVQVMAQKLELCLFFWA